MSTQPPPPTRDDWRRPVASGERRKTGPKWRREVDPAAPRRARRVKALKASAAILAFVVLGALLIWVSTWLWPPHPTSLVLVGAGYEQNLAIPHNAYGRKSLRSLAGLTVPPGSSSSWDSGRLRLEDGPRIFTTDAPWDAGLARFRGRTLLLYLALHGGSDRDGPYLLPDDADARPVAENRLRLSAVLDRLAKLPEDVNKILVLDATQFQSRWELGMLHNDFARGLAALEPRIAAIPRLLVLSATDVDQRSWSCDALGQTIFASSLIEGLAGGAKGDDGRIDAEELYLHVRARVERWVGLHLQERQTPVLFPSGEEGGRRARAIELCVADPDAPASAPGTSRADRAATGVPGPPDRLMEAWRTHQRLHQAYPPPWVYRPHEWRVYKATLIRYDELIRAGSADQATELALRLGEMEREIGRSQVLPL